MPRSRSHTVAAACVAAAVLASRAPAQPFPECDTPPPGAGNCLTPTPGIPGCLDPLCCGTVCTDDAFCCDTEWDSSCVDLALLLCALAVNDDCADAIAVELGKPLDFDTTNATTDGSGAPDTSSGFGVQLHEPTREFAEFFQWAVEQVEKPETE